MTKYRFILLLSIILNLTLIGSIFYLVNRLGGLKFMIHRIQQGGLAGLYENRKDLFEHLPLEKGSIIFLGDSLTEFGQWSELLPYPTIKNRGIAGETTDGLLRRLDGVLASRPNAIFLMIGINDFLFFNRKKILENYNKIINDINKKSPKTKLFIQSLLPVNKGVRNNVFDNKEIARLNGELKILCEKKGITYLDLHSLLLDDKGQLATKYTADGVHINGAAYLIWKEVVFDYIIEL